MGFTIFECFEMFYNAASCLNRNLWENVINSTWKLGRPVAPSLFYIYLGNRDPSKPCAVLRGPAPKLG